MTPFDFIVGREDDFEGEVVSRIEFIFLFRYFVREGRRGFGSLTREGRGEVGSRVNARTGSEELNEPGWSVFPN